MNVSMMRTVLAAGLVGVLLSRGDAQGEGDLRREAADRFGILQPVPAARRQTSVVKLGRALFWDERVSATGKTACASCHLPADWGADRRPASVDARGKKTGRNSQTVLNAMLQPALRWTGDRKSGAHQAERSLAGSMGFAQPEDAVPVLKKLGYAPLFQAAFPKETDPIAPARYGQALQAYQETLITPAPFDRYLAGEEGALDAQQKHGLRVFLKTGCADCHRGPLLGGTGLRKFGVAKDYWTLTRSPKIDEGLFQNTKKEGDRYKFRVAMLRNIAKTAPYFHDGSVGALQQAVQVMAEAQLGERLPEADARAVVAFLDALTGDIPADYAPLPKD